MLWATGYRRVYSWLNVPVLDGRGEIVGTLGSGSDFFEGAMLYRRTYRAEMDAYLRMLGLSRDDIR